MGLVQSRIDEIESKLNSLSTNSSSSQPNAGGNLQLGHGRTQIHSYNIASNHNPNYKRKRLHKKSHRKFWNISNFDAFSRTVNFTSNRKDMYRTSCGGCATLLIIALMVLYLLIIISNPLKSYKTIDTEDEAMMRMLQTTETYDLSFTTEYSYSTVNQYYDIINNYSYFYPGTYNYQMMSYVPNYDYSGVYIEFYICDRTSSNNGYDYIDFNW